MEHKRPRGRPRAENDPRLLKQAKIIAWKRYVERKRWAAIASELRMKPTTTSIRKLQRRLDILAEKLWRAVGPLPNSPWFETFKPLTEIYGTERHHTEAAECEIVATKASLDRRAIRSFLEKTLSEEVLEHPAGRAHWQARTGLPFKSHSAECRKIVCVLAPRGADVALRVFED